MTDESDTHAWIRTEPSLDGKTYVVTLSFTQDFIVTLTPTRALAYSAALLSALADAEYDHAVWQQVTQAMGLGDPEALAIVKQLRDSRPAREASGLVFEPIVSATANVPMVNVRNATTGEGYTQWEGPQARRHALHVLEAPTVADLDALYHRLLRHTVDVEDHVARNAVDDIRNWRLGWEVDNS